VTWFVPSDRLVVPTKTAFAPLPAVGVPVVGTGGQAAAHVPVQALVVPESAPNMYTVRPCESTKMFPRRLLRTATAGGAGGAVVRGALDRGAVDALVWPEPHPASAMSRMTAAPAKSVEMDVRLVTGNSFRTALAAGAPRF
jgi:hypothetical protein